MTQSSRFCSNCGATVAADARFCESCGKPVAAQPPTTPPRETAPVQTPPPDAPPPGSMPPPPAYVPPPATGSKKWLIAGGAGVVVLGLIGCLLVAGLGVFFYLRTSQAPLAAVAAPSATSIAPATAAPAPSAIPPLPPTAIPTAIPTAAPPTQPPPATPTAEPAPDFSSQGIRFSYDPALASEVELKLVEAQTGTDIPPWELSPEHRVVFLNGYPSDSQARHFPQILIYPVQDYLEVDPGIGDRYANLQQMLLTRSTDTLPDDLPFFPSWNAAQVIAARVAYLDFKNGSGVRYLSQYGQDVYPINNQSLFYTFQGLTADKKWLISAIFPVSNPDLPDPDSLLQNADFYDTYLAYLDSARILLEDFPADSYQPDLALLDALIQSLDVD